MERQRPREPEESSSGGAKGQKKEPQNKRYLTGKNTDSILYVLCSNVAKNMANVNVKNVIALKYI